MRSVVNQVPVSGRPAASGEQRKVVTIVFCDLVGSTSLAETLDPEAWGAFLERYSGRMREIVGRHGGTVEKFIGDAVMAVFGVPQLHEDDALRAACAAVEMRAALLELGARGCIGVNSGEVVSGAEERLAVGDAVNVAERLQAAAAPGEILIGEGAADLLRGGVELERLEPLELKGKTRPVAAYRLLGVTDGRRDSTRSPFVGRAHELALLVDAWGRACADGRCELVTVVGEAGVGKTRLVEEFLRKLEARVVEGRCLPYGDGITYWPVVETLRQLEVRPRDEAAAAAVDSLLGETAAVAADEIAWAVRKTFEHAAAERPLVVVFDDVHSGEQTFLDLIEHVALLSTGAPILLVCLARPELLDRRPGWPVALRLGPLSEGEVEQLMPSRASATLRRRISRAAGGNPLFVREMVALADEEAGDVVVPPRLQALLAARLDGLARGERAVLQRGAVEGEVFHRGTLQALAPDEPRLTHHLAALVRRGLIRPHATQLAGDDGFRFEHLLMRDAAYEALAKATRAELHERLAALLEERAAGVVELDQILGYHLERAVRYREEIGLPVRSELRESARRRLSAAGHRAHEREDYAAAAALLGRSCALLPAETLDLGLELELEEALFYGNRADEAVARAEALAERAASRGDPIGELCGRIQAAAVRVWLEPEDSVEQLANLVERSLPRFEAAHDDLALCVAHRALGQVAQARALWDESVEAYEHAAADAARASRSDRFVHWRNIGRFHGTLPLSEFLAWQDGLDERDRRDWSVRHDRAWALAMLGRIEEARTQLVELRADLAERGATFLLAIVGGEAGVDIELLARDPGAAVSSGEEACAALDRLGQEALLRTCAALLARALCERGRLEDAAAWAERAAAADASEDRATQAMWRQARAKVLARCGEHTEAERLAREAVAITEPTETLSWQADAYADLGDVLASGGRHREAAEALEQALARYERKENLVMADRMRARLAGAE